MNREMPFGQANQRDVKCRLARPFLLLLLMLTALGAVVASTVIKQRDVSTQVTVEMFQRDGQSGWKVVDRTQASSSFTTSVADLAGDKEARTDFIWNGRSEKGRLLAIRWDGPAKIRFDPTSGLIEARVRFDISIDGKKVSAPAKFSTESVDSPGGALHGQRCILSNGALAAGLVGTFVIRERDLIANPTAVGKGGTREKNETVERSGRVGDGAGNSGELIVVVKATGRTSAK